MSYSQVRGFLLVFVIRLHSPLIKPFVSEEADIITIMSYWYLGWQECVKALCSFSFLATLIKNMKDVIFWGLLFDIRMPCV